MSSKKILIPLLFLLVACGNEEVTDFEPSVSTQSLPIVQRVAPTTGRAGDTITVFGSGFSSEATSNIVHIGASTAIGKTYGLANPQTNGEIEQVTFVIPEGASAGDDIIFVSVFDWSSNTNVSLAVTP